MSDLLDRIVNVSIELENLASSSASYSAILLVIPLPESAAEDEEIPNLLSIPSAADLKTYGYTSSESAYIAASIVFSQSPSPDKVYVTVRQQTDDGYEDLDVTLDRVNSNKWYGFALVGFEEVGDIEAAIKWAESNEKLFGYTLYTIERAVTIEGYYRTFEAYSAEVEDDESYKYLALAMMAKCFGYESGSETWALKTLSGIPTSTLTTAEMDTLDEQGISYYIDIDGTSVTQGGKVMAGEWIDVIRFRDWLKNEIKSNIFNVLLANTKVPYTDAGITLIHSAITTALKDGQDVGGIAPTEYDEDGTETPGYTVSVPRASQVSKATKKSRVLPDCTFTARLAGAIHVVEVSGKLEN